MKTAQLNVYRNGTYMFGDTCVTDTNYIRSKLKLIKRMDKDDILVIELVGDDGRTIEKREIYRKLTKAR